MSGENVLEHEQKMLHLEVLKTLKPKLSQLETLKAKILCEVERCLKEISTSEECEREIHILEMEKRLHEEAIKNLDKDINELETSVSQSKVEQDILKSHAKQLVDEFNPLKREVNEIRTSIGLDTLPDLTEVDVILKKKK
ncbi:zinc finger C4H2 domain-containing protein-like [Clytia hemisphaerica]